MEGIEELEVYLKGRELDIREKLNIRMNHISERKRDTQDQGLADQGLVYIVQ